MTSEAETSAAALLEQLESLTSQFSLQDEKTRAKALQLSRQLTASLENPKTVAVELATSGFFPLAARIGVDLGLFEAIRDHDGPVSSEALAGLTGGEELLIVRLLRAMSAIGFVDEVGERLWEANAVTRVMATEVLAAEYRMHHDLTVSKLIAVAPTFFRENGYRCPSDPRKGWMQRAFGSDRLTFEILPTMPAIFRDFNTFMGSHHGGREHWTDWYPVGARLLDGAGPDGALLVDVGGGKGHDVLAFHEKHPGRGRLVLQDLPAVVDRVRGLDPAIEAMAYDFFTEQPIQGARAYFYHHVLHDWSDEDCLKILRRAKGGMRPGYSRLLVNELVVPERRASPFHAASDLIMMAFCGGMERTEGQWRALFTAAGLEVVRIWQPPFYEDGEAIVEAMVKEEP
ncbi:sterigmatocystin 8-O-methyltransferase [Xylaria palmicola]|nr:sterigmatocystin 8-O-methyltransferase [Xylaria palmicola]